jgi:hypothetical protein
MTSDDDKISRRYRELARDEPPRQIDEAVLAAARRAVDARPAPLVAPTGRRRWYFPLAAAAIIVLAVAVTVHVERQSPDLEMVEAPLRQEPAPAAQAPAEPPREFTLDPKREAPQKLRAQREAEVLADSEKRQVAPAAPAASPPETSTSEARDSVRADAAARPQARAETQSVMREKSAALGALARASPEQWLQGIADLRSQGRHDEADKALAEFRRAYPDYRLSEAMLEKVEKKR